MKVKTVRVNDAGQVMVGSELAGKQYDRIVHEDGRIELFPVSQITSADAIDVVNSLSVPTESRKRKERVRSSCRLYLGYALPVSTASDALTDSAIKHALDAFPDIDMEGHTSMFGCDDVSAVEFGITASDHESTDLFCDAVRERLFELAKEAGHVSGEMPVGPTSMHGFTQRPVC